MDIFKFIKNILLALSFTLILNLIIVLYVFLFGYIIWIGLLFLTIEFIIISRLLNKREKIKLIRGKMKQTENGRRK